jgi:hypothetical protein
VVVPDSQHYGIPQHKGHAQDDIQQLSKENNSTVGMKYLLEFVINANHTNVILMNAPHRYDLMRNSCVSNEMGKFNRKLRIRLERLGESGNDRCSQ